MQYLRFDIFRVYGISWLVQRRNTLRIITDCSWGKDSDVWSKLILSRSWCAQIMLVIKSSSIPEGEKELCWALQRAVGQLCLLLNRGRWPQAACLKGDNCNFLWSFFDSHLKPCLLLRYPGHATWRKYSGVSDQHSESSCSWRKYLAILRSDAKGQCSQKSNHLVHQPRPILPWLLDGLYTCLRQSGFNLNRISSGE